MSQFEPQGTLPRPGPLGRIVRLLLGIACLQFLWVLITDGSAIAGASAAPSHPGWWFGLLVGLYVFSYVVNIGFSLDLGRWPQILVVVAGISLLAWGWITRGAVWTPALGWLLVVWLTYTFAHLGGSFVLSALLATPGCEMRAILHLFTLVTGHKTAEHFCPGPLRFVDEWEAGR